MHILENMKEWQKSEKSDENDKSKIFESEILSRDFAKNDDLINQMTQISNYRNFNMLILNSGAIR